MKNIGKTYKEKSHRGIIVVYSYEKERRNEMNTIKNSDETVFEEKMIVYFTEFLEEKECAPATIEKYARDIKTFTRYLGSDKKITKQRLLAYKEWLIENYCISSVNSMIAALNQFLIYIEMGRLRLKRVKEQGHNMNRAGRELSGEEFRSLVRTARESGKNQTAMIMETMCATGIRISELKFFCVENIESGMVKVRNKGKCRIVLIPRILQKKLRIYIRRNGIRKGMIFCTKSGKAKDRSNIWKEMKAIAKIAGINLEKVFPHNLRHLFARTFYKTTKDLINLADILGHSSVEVTRIYTSDGIQEWRRSLEKIKLLEI